MRILGLLLAAVIGCSGGSTATKEKAPVTQPAASIGMATMQAEGTIVLMLRAEGEGGAVGDAMFTYAKGNPQYEDVLKHVGGLKPGETKPVPPWPEGK